MQKLLILKEIVKLGKKKLIHLHLKELDKNEDSISVNLIEGANKTIFFIQDYKTYSAKYEIDINNKFITTILINPSGGSGGIPVYDSSGNLTGYQVGGFFYKYELLTDPEFNDIEYDSSGNPISNIANKPLYVPFIRGIIERIRIQLLQMIWTDKLTLTGFWSNS